MIGLHTHPLQPPGRVRGTGTHFCVSGIEKKEGSYYPDVCF
jgi:hypothetical protein